MEGLDGLISEKYVQRFGKPATLWRSHWYVKSAPNSDMWNFFFSFFFFLLKLSFSKVS